MTNQFKNNNEAVATFEYILEMPDELFKTVYPTMREEFVKSAKSGEFKTEFEKGFSSEAEKINVLNSIEEARQEILDDDCLSEEKREFLLLLWDTIENILEDVPFRDSVNVQIEYCHENAKEPTYANSTDAGCDVYAVEDNLIAPGDTKVIPTGLKMAIPNGWMISVRPRSGMSAKTGIRIANAPGTIDAGYRNEVGIILHNTSNTPYQIHAGDRIAQFVIERCPMIKFHKVDNVLEIEGDRQGGFGHTGK